MIVQFLRRCALLVRRGGALDDLEEEMRLHVALRAEKNRQQGMRQDEAARAARRRFGNVLRLREESRDAWGFARLEHVAPARWNYLGHRFEFAVKPYRAVNGRTPGDPQAVQQAVTLLVQAQRPLLLAGAWPARVWRARLLGSPWSLA